jgi:SAM-dependent methyltransferase
MACDISPSAVACAKERCRELANVEIHQRDVAEGAPEGTFDLIVFSELGYYFSADRLDVLDRFARATGPHLLAYDANIVRQRQALALYIRQCHGERDLASIPAANETPERIIPSAV